MTARPSRDQKLVGIGVISTSVLPLVIIGVAGRLEWWMPLVVLVLLVAALSRQDSYLDSLLLVAVVACWIGGGDATHPFATLGVALLVLALHAALSMRASAPLQAPFDRLIWARWLGRLGVMGAVAAVAWEITWSLQRARLTGSGIAVVIAMLACLGVALMMRRLLEQDG